MSCFKVWYGNDSFKCWCLASKSEVTEWSTLRDYVLLPKGDLNEWQSQSRMQTSIRVELECERAAHDLTRGVYKSRPSKRDVFVKFYDKRHSARQLVGIKRAGQKRDPDPRICTQT